MVPGGGKHSDTFFNERSVRINPNLLYKNVRRGCHSAYIYTVRSRRRHKRKASKRLVAPAAASGASPFSLWAEIHVCSFRNSPFMIIGWDQASKRGWSDDSAFLSALETFQSILAGQYLKEVLNTILVSYASGALRSSQGTWTRQ